ncbi:alpha-tubulin suppressor-like RCC1 family protein [Peptococcaceae bacterium DYL19]|nr:alpha-tubulin suppressor-like RCC1 family protein [Phosphitispora fastidiosa]
MDKFYSLAKLNIMEKPFMKLYGTLVAGHRHTVGLKSDGTVTAVGDNKYGQCDVRGLRNSPARK